jgi:hypothetical protein
MSKVKLEIIDDDGGFPPLVMQFDELGFEPQGSVPSEVSKDYRRELVKHPIPLLDRDIGQDMGAHSREYQFSGLCKLDVRDGLEARFLAAQITASSPGGRWTIIYTNRNGVTVLDQSGLAIESYNWSYQPGMPDWYRYTLRLVEFLGQT